MIYLFDSMDSFNAIRFTFGWKDRVEDIDSLVPKNAFQQRLIGLVKGADIVCKLSVVVVHLILNGRIGQGGDALKLGKLIVDFKNRKGADTDILAVAEKDGFKGMGEKFADLKIL